MNPKFIRGDRSRSSVAAPERYRVAELVEVRSAVEILATLDAEGSVQAMPLMPEMLQYCGRQFRVMKSAHKSCDTISTYRNRSLPDSYHLEGLRCDGRAHGDCDAACLLVWKSAWLKRVSEPGPTGDRPASPAAEPLLAGQAGECDLAALDRLTQPQPGVSEAGRTLYRCQATEMFRATSPIAPWDLRPFVRDLSSGNVGLWCFVKFSLLAISNKVRSVYWKLGRYPMIKGTAGTSTPSQTLNLTPAELVEVRSKQEIMGTLNPQGRNRGLFFDVEMLRFCGQRLRVRSRVERFVNDRNGEMIRLPNPCVILEGAACGGCISRGRLFCPRAIYPFWRDAWLKRVD